MTLSNPVQKEILSKLDILVRLTAAGIIQGKSPSEQIKLLAQTGLKPKDIANITGKTANNVRVTLSYLKKLSRKKKKTSKN